MSFWEPLFGSKESWRKMSWPLRVFMGLITFIGIGFFVYLPGLLIPLGLYLGYKWWKEKSETVS